MTTIHMVNQSQAKIFKLTNPNDLISSFQEKANNRRNKKYRQKDRGQEEEEGDETEMRVQLEKLGLALKEISGDG